MLLVIDANVLFSAAIKDSKTAELLLSDKIELITPEFVLSEFQEHKKEILDKTHRTSEDFDKFLSVLMDRIEVVPFSEIKPFLKKAEKISPDKNDAHYFALAIKNKCPIWSQDRKLKEQNIIKIYSTIKLVKELSL